MNCFRPTPSPLGDNLVGLVHPRAPAGRLCTGVVDMTTSSLYYPLPHTDNYSPISYVDDFGAKREASRALLYLTSTKTDGLTQLRFARKPSPTSSAVADKSLDQDTDPYHRKRAEVHEARRREQCRANQARYRDKQRHAQLALETSVGQLNQELVTLKRKFRDVSSRKRSNQTPWSITVEVFRLIEASFCSPWRMTSTQEMKRHAETRYTMTVLEQAFAHDAAMGDLQGVDTLLEQLRLYSQYFGTPSLQLQRIESVTPIVLAAQATLSMTVTEFTLRHMFPHVMDLSSQDHGKDGDELLYQRLLDQRLECNCSMTFFFDEDRDRVVRVSIDIELIPALLRVLGSLSDVAEVLEHAKISLESVVGDVDGDSAASETRSHTWSVS
ncbi:unnamed protein product [Hyaloperonospora brassicae]|uniref:Bzip transcription factor n=1 Tax=Hyaloperonospora brassicae TaxID=162125 RepID=A0AAV0ULF5_HYABA|nr:unnamed protein product [Hyaloperonospora brassicae]